MARILLPLLLLLAFQSPGQEQLTSEMLDRLAFRFSLSADNSFPETAHDSWDSWIGENQFVGLAEVHNSRQLSFFTMAILELLDKKEFDQFALELGPNSTEILNESGLETTVGETIKTINQQYGKKSIYKTPLIFINKMSDALFMNKAETLGYKFWGIDQEYAFSFEMLFDRIYSLTSTPSQEQEIHYKQAKELLQKNIFRNKVNGQPVYCWFASDPTLTEFLNSFSGAPTTDKIIADIRESWDIYCKSALGQGSNQLRADHMKSNFESYYAVTGNASKVFLKLGGVHLTHGKSPFGVNDIGMHLHDKATQNDTGYLSIRHLITFRNGKSNIGKSGWKTVTMFLELGRKDQWTAVDLRPFRKQLQEGLISTNDKYAFELMSYDILLISPDDQYDEANY